MFKGPKGKMVLDLFEKEMTSALKGKYKTPEDFEKEGTQLILSFRAKGEIAREVDSMSKKPEYSGKEGAEVLKKIRCRN